jgi:FtsP/CotA-like multicopper oxidase with cupredoxin domain
MFTRREMVQAGLVSAASALASPLSATEPEITLRIEEVTHEVAPGFRYRTTAYNGTVPGGIIRLRENRPVTVAVHNHTGAEEHVHWHGLDVAPEIDGTSEEKSLSVPPHGVIRYSVRPRQSGVRWVHSHAMSGMGDLRSATYSGQFAFVYVEPAENRGRYDKEIFLATHEWGPSLIWQKDEDDPNNNATARLSGLPETVVNSGNYEVKYDIGSINGKAFGAGEPLRVKYGQRVLFHFLNASATESIRLSLAGHQFLVVALDGNAVPIPGKAEVIQLGSGERVDAMVEMNNPGVWILGAVGEEDRVTRRVAIVVEYAGRSGPARWVAPPQETRWNYYPFGNPGPAFGKPALIETSGSFVPLTIARRRPGPDGMEKWTINGETFNPGAPPRQLRRGEAHHLVFENRTDEDHPLHLHRYSFEVETLNGRPLSGVIKDTVVLRARQRMQVRLTPMEPGLALFHCHNQMHMNNGFKTLFEVI